MASGGGDAIVTIWDLEHLIPISTITRHEWPIRSVSFSHDGYILASASQEGIDISRSEDGQQMVCLETHGEINAVSWHPTKNLLCYTSDPAEKSSRSSGLFVFGLEK